MLAGPQQLRSNGAVHANVISFVAGVAMLQSMPDLPPALAWPLLAASAAALLAVAGRHSRGARWRAGALAGACLLAGFGWAGLRAELRLAEALPMALEGRDLELTGVIASLPEDGAEAVRFDLRVAESAVHLPGRLRLSWYRPRGEALAALPRLAPGQRWRLTVRLRRPHAHLNPDGPDLEGRMLEAGVRATGYVRGNAANRLLDERADGPGLAIERMRADLRARFDAVLGERPWAGMLIAMTLGDQAAMPAQHWSLFQRTGLVHLAVVSGLHISMMAGLAGLLGSALCRRSRLALLIPAPKFAVIAGLACGWAYALLAGLGIPVLRSVIMLTAVALCLLLDRRVSRSRMLALALLVVTLVDPWCVLAPGFWLSFCAVAILLLVAAGQGGERRPMLLTLLKAQIAINLAMIPALLIFFHQFSLVAPLANLLAVPVVSFVVLPLCLLFVLVPVDLLLLVAHGVVDLMMAPIGALAGARLAVWQQAAPPAGLLAVAAAGCAWGLLPRGTPGRAIALLGLLPLLAFVPARPGEGEFTVTTLDVGQGLAVHVRTAGHDLLFDSGPDWPAGDAGERVVLPYLRAQGVSALDALVVSHDDNDHAGGALSILRALPVRRRMSHAGFRAREASGTESWESCSDAGEWRWDGVRFRWLNPPASGIGDWPRRGDNNLSCVLSVEGRGGRALLTADIEAVVESRLVRAAPAELAADLLLAPHHGSRSSSSMALVDAVRPRAVVFSAGYRSPFGHPHAEVWARWAAAGARGYRTDSQGAVRAQFTAGGLELDTERAARARYWHGR